MRRCQCRQQPFTVNRVVPIHLDRYYSKCYSDFRIKQKIYRNWTLKSEQIFFLFLTLMNAKNAVRICPDMKLFWRQFKHPEFRKQTLFLPTLRIFQAYAPFSTVWAFSPHWVDWDQRRATSRRTAALEGAGYEALDARLLKITVFYIMKHKSYYIKLSPIYATVFVVRMCQPGGGLQWK